MHRLFGTSKKAGGNDNNVDKGDGDGDGKGETKKVKPTLGSTAAGMDVKVKELDVKIRSIDQELLRYKDQLKR